MKRSRQHNVFAYYRGPTISATPGATEKQIEDNTTKALINTLEYGGKSLTDSFVQRFVGLDAPEGEWEYLLQRGPAAAAAPERYLVGLSASGARPDAVPPTPDAGSRVDGVLHVHGQLLVAIESKVGSAELDAQQFAAHAERWQVPEPCRLAARWIDIYRWARDEQPADPVARFLLDQLREYLELTGLSPYGGFRRDDFDALAGDDAAARAQTKERLAGVWEFVLDQLKDDETAALGELHSANLDTGERRTSRQTNWSENVINFTLELAAEPERQLELDIVAWNRDVAAAFEAWLRSARGESQLRELAGYQLVLFFRRAVVGSSGNPYWRKETHRHVWIVDAPAFTADELDRQLAARDERWELAAYHLRRAWPEPEVVGGGEAIAIYLAGEIRRLLPLLAEINASKFARGSR